MISSHAIFITFIAGSILDLLRHRWCMTQSPWALTVSFCVMSENGNVLLAFAIYLNLRFHFFINWVTCCCRLCNFCWKSAGVFCQIDIWCLNDSSILCMNLSHQPFLLRSVLHLLNEIRKFLLSVPIFVQ